MNKTQQNQPQPVYVLKIRYSGEEDDVYVFHKYGDACVKAFEYFDMLRDHTIPEDMDIKRLDEWCYDSDRGYFVIFHTNIQ